MNLINKNNIFDIPCTAVDPVTKGVFKIEWAFIMFDEDDLINGVDYPPEVKYQGKIVITSENDNLLYRIAKESPLRLQNLVASVNFGSEKRFIKIETILQYGIFPEINGIEQIDLNPVTFAILDNLEYMEKLVDYKDSNLL